MLRSHFMPRANTIPMDFQGSSGPKVPPESEKCRRRRKETLIGSLKIMSLLTSSPTVSAAAGFQPFHQCARTLSSPGSPLGPYDKYRKTSARIDCASNCKSGVFDGQSSSRRRETCGWVSGRGGGKARAWSWIPSGPAETFQPACTPLTGRPSSPADPARATSGYSWCHDRGAIYAHPQRRKALWARRLRYQRFGGGNV